jgi:hypothetical protein
LKYVGVEDQSTIINGKPLSKIPLYKQKTVILKRLYGYRYNISA